MYIFRCSWVEVFYRPKEIFFLIDTFKYYNRLISCIKSIKLYIDDVTKKGWEEIFVVELPQEIFAPFVSELREMTQSFLFRLLLITLVKSQVAKN